MLIAAQTVAELRYGAFRVGWGVRRTARLEALIAAYPVAYQNDAICTMWAKVRVDAERAGRNISPNDAWIAATALELGVPLVTHNTRDFKTVKGLTIITQNPV